MIKKYNASMRIMHWTLSALIIGMLAIGLYMTSLADTHPSKWDWYAWHKSFGVLLLLMIPLRIINRIMSKIPALPRKLSKCEKLLSSITIFLLYVAMVTMPLSGYLMSTAGGYDVVAFGINILSIPNTPMPELAGIMYQIHVNCAYMLIAAIILHIVGTLKHVIIDKVNLLNRII